MKLQVMLEYENTSPDREYEDYYVLYRFDDIPEDDMKRALGDFFRAAQDGLIYDSIDGGTHRDAEPRWSSSVEPDRVMVWNMVSGNWEEE